MVGNISPSNEINMATIWLGATVEINMPKLNAIKINKNDSPISRKKTSFNGHSKNEDSQKDNGQRIDERQQ